MAEFVTRFSVERPRTVVGVTLVATLALALLAAVPSVWPERFPGLAGVRVDTDPENMLREDEAVLRFTHRMQQALALHDMVVLGVVNDAHPNGVFNPATLERIDGLTRFAATLRGAAIGSDDPMAGVVAHEMIAPSLVDNIEQGGPGEVRFEWLMATPPATDAEALAVREKARRIPFLEGTLVSEDGLALALYLPLTRKDLSYRIYRELGDYIATLDGPERYYVTGLPVAEDTFGVEMFIQMAVSAPLAMLVIFLLMLAFFRKPVLVVSPMIVALVSVILTMGLLVVTGHTIHIMSSMIPIFIMPIAVQDSIHILSEFFDRYQKTRDRQATIGAVMATLYSPMLYTSLTSAAGFASLALTPIPPVQVFGLFVAIGVLLAWVLTITLIPAYVMLIPERSLANFGLGHGPASEESRGWLSRALQALGRGTYAHPRLVLVLAGLAAALAVVGISRIEVNDNPTNWFRASHPIREADRVLNEHFGGTYMAYLALVPRGEMPEAEAAPDSVPARPAETRPRVEEPALPSGLGDEPSLPAGLDGEPAGDGPTSRSAAPAGEELLEELFKDPQALSYLADLQRHLLTTGVVGKSSSLADIVRTVHRELIDGSDREYRIPDTSAAVAQTLTQFQSGHRPGDLWHFVTPDFRTSSIWVQMKSGDNKDMERVVKAVERFVVDRPPPFDLEHRWFGLTYINVVWQDKMVSGMLSAIAGSFVVVLLMMIVLFRSPLWGLLSMVPLTVTIALIYGVIGLVGKDYDMPVAVLSSLTLGLAVDFAIHLLARAREIRGRLGSWKNASPGVFGEPARAIARNVLVIAIGFTPLLVSPLVPYRTVGVLLAAILLASGAATLTILPAILQLAEGLLFRKSPSPGLDEPDLPDADAAARSRSR